MKIRQRPSSSRKPRHLGVYYTGADITDYIAKYTIIPCLFDMAERHLPEAFQPEGTIWRLLQKDPDRYLYAAFRHGVDHALPQSIAAGVDDVSRRQAWQQLAAQPFTLSAETWREHLVRRHRCSELREQLRTGQVRAMDDLITLNLDIQRFAQDVLAACDQAESLNAFWHGLESITILDPACGSGEFLLAALRILEPLYEACVDRLQPYQLNRRSFIRRSIIERNLFGVDIRSEALAVCRQRLEMESPNLRVGNSLVGLATLTSAERTRRTGRKPFHWPIEFPEVMDRGGFDVVLGNPPYVEARDIKASYQVHDGATLSCGNLSAFFLERSTTLAKEGGRVGMIVPLSCFSTKRMIPLVQDVKKRSSLLHLASFAWRPGKLFDNVNLPLAIVLQKKGIPPPLVFSTRYIHWDSEARSVLFSGMEFAEVSDERLPGSVPKLGSPLAASLLARLRAEGAELQACLAPRSANRVHYRRGGLYWKVFVDFPTGSSEEKILHLRPEVDRYLIIAVLSSSLWFWYFTVTSDCRHLGNRDIGTFPLDVNALSRDERDELSRLGRAYVADLKRHARRKIRVYRTTRAVQCLAFFVKRSKPILDAIDRVLARHYGFTDEELDFILHYDIKHRLGQHEPHYAH